METADVYGVHFCQGRIETQREPDRGLSGDTTFHTADGLVVFLCDLAEHRLSAAPRCSVDRQAVKKGCVSLSRRGRLRRCEAPSLGRRPQPFPLEPDIIMQGAIRDTGRIKGEHSSGLENLLQTGRSVDVCVVQQHRMKCNQTTG